MKILFLLALFAPLFCQAAFDPLQEAEDLRLPEAPALSQAVSSRNPALRARAAKTYGRIMSPKSVDPLLQLSTDPDEKVRAEAAFALGQLGWIPEASDARRSEIDSALANLLREKKPAMRALALEAIGKVGQAAAADLLTHSFSSKDAAVRAAAVNALFRSRMIQKLRQPESPPGPLSPALLDHLLKLAADRDPSTRRAVAYFFARNNEPRAEATVARLSREKDPWARMFALQGLAKMKAKSAKADLERALRDSVANVRYSALSALVAAGESLLPFSSLQKDSSFHVRALFAQSLDGKKSQEELSLLEQILQNDSSASVKAEALKSLAKAKEASALFAWLNPLCKQPEWQLREACVAASEPLVESDRERFLLSLYADDNQFVKVAALEAIGAIPSASAFQQVKASLESAQLAERATAVGALRDRKEAEVVELAWKTYQASLERKWVETREDLLEILIKNKNDSTTAYLKLVLEDPAPSVRAKAKQALLARGLKDLPEPPEPSLSRSPFRELHFRRNPLVEIETNRGSFLVECFAKDAPLHVADFVGHVKAKFYDGLLWHRVVSNFVIQGGDPDGSGFGDAGYSLRAEINRQLFARGSLGMPRSQGFDTGGGQLFFNHVPTPHLDGQYTVFGRVVRGLEVLDRIERGDKIVRARVLK